MNNKIFISEVNAALDLLPGRQNIAKEFLSDKSSIRRYVIGRNDQSAALIKKYKIDGVVDDYDKNNADWLGVPLISMAQLPSNSVVVNCSTSISPVLVSESLHKAGVEHIVSVNEIIHAANGAIALPWFVIQQREDYQQHMQDWEKLYELMADQDSRQTLLDTVRYRLTANEQYMQSYRVRLKDQYFEDFLDLHEEVFVDAGGFDGDTTEEFCLRCNDYRKVFIFEPSVKNMAAAKKRLKTFKKIDYLEVGLSDLQGKLHFNADAGSASSVIEGGGESIDVTTLDAAVNEPVSFIKMDLEGWELKALAGAAEHIKQDKPKLAIAVYHSASDFRNIANYVLSLNPNYRIYLRHYTQGWSETVMFFIS
jgi:FkbM family methyltransferase